MSSLSNLYQELVHADAEFAKEAGEEEEVLEHDEETVKMASEYDASGRALAHALFAGVQEEVEEEGNFESQSEKIAAIKQRMIQDPEYAAYLVAKFQQNS